MIGYSGNKMIAFYYMKLAITKIAYGAVTIWEKITSCFGSGTWNKDKSWVSSEIWKNN